MTVSGGRLEKGRFSPSWWEALDVLLDRVSALELCMALNSAGLCLRKALPRDLIALLELNPAFYLVKSAMETSLFELRDYGHELFCHPVLTFNNGYPGQSCSADRYVSIL